MKVTRETPSDILIADLVRGGELADSLMHLRKVFEGYRDTIIGRDDEQPYSPGSARAVSYDMGRRLAKMDMTPSKTDTKKKTARTVTKTSAEWTLNHAMGEWWDPATVDELEATLKLQFPTRHKTVGNLLKAAGDTSNDRAEKDWVAYDRNWKKAHSLLKRLFKGVSA